MGIFNVPAESTTNMRGSLPKLSGNAAQVLSGVGTWVAGGGGGASEFIAGISVANYAALPDPVANSGLMAIVLASSGVWLINYKAKGLYLSNGTAWLWEAEFVTAIEGLTGTIAQFNAACTDADFATGGGTATGNNTGDQTISDATISTSDITTNNASAAKHGFLPKLSNVATEFLNGQGAWATPAGGGGGNTEIWIRQAAARTLANVGTEQQLFDSVANGRLTMATGVYFFDCQMYLTDMSATSGNLAFDLLGAGTAVFGDVLYHAFGADNIAGQALSDGATMMIQAQSPASIMSAGTSPFLTLTMSGTFEITTAGTIIPSVTLVTAAAAVLAAGSYFNCRKVAEVDAVSAGAWD